MSSIYTLLNACGEITLLNIDSYSDLNYTITYLKSNAARAEILNQVNVVDQLNTPSLKDLVKKAKESGNNSLWFAETSESIVSGCFATHYGQIETIRLAVDIVISNYETREKKREIDKILTDLSTKLQEEQK